MVVGGQTTLEPLFEVSLLRQHLHLQVAGEKHAHDLTAHNRPSLQALRRVGKVILARAA